MCLFCDEMTQEKLRELRGDKPTTYIVKAITEYDYYRELYPIIVGNREKLPTTDASNTPNYFLASAFKILALKEAKNQIQASHYFWVDLGIANVVRNVQLIQSALQSPRSKVAICYIHYRSHEELYPVRKFLNGDGKCCFGTGFFSVEKDYVECLYNLFMKVLRRQVVEEGVGHSDSQCFVYMYDSNPEVFNLFFGDYYSMVENYHRSVGDHDSIRRHFIEKAQADNKMDVVALAQNSMLKID